MRRNVALVIALSLAGWGCVTDGEGPSAPGDPRGIRPGPLPTAPGPGSLDLLRDFSGCPELTDLETSDFAGKWSDLASSTGACGNCHVDAAVGGYEPIIGDAAAALDQMTTSRAGVGVFFEVAGGDVVVNDHFDATAGGTAPFVEHPRYDLDGTGTLQALYDVYTRAHQRFLDGTCDPPRF